MAEQQQLPPAYSTSQHDPDRLSLPAVPQTEPAQQWQPPPHEHAPNGPQTSLRLPPIQSLLSSSQTGDDQLSQLRLPDVPQTLPGIAMASRDLDVSSPMDVDDVAGTTPSTESRSGRAGSIVSMDDPDVRIAAEALGDLRADFIQSPPQSHSAMFDTNAPSLSLFPTTSSTDFGVSQQSEPLLSLLTTSHPMLSNAIAGSLSAYSTSKNRSPRFVKYGAELMERHIGSPVASTVNSMGRRTGVEGSVRRYLGGGQSSPQHEEPDGDEKGVKRRRMDPDSIDVERGLLQRQPETYLPLSETVVESLPAYDDHRSPSYEEGGPTTGLQSTPSPSTTWQSRLMMSTSGLGVAMSEESLKRLKFCLEWLRAANRFIGTAIVELKSALEDWDRAHQGLRQQRSGDPADAESGLSSQTEPVADDDAATAVFEKTAAPTTTRSAQEEDDELDRRIKKWKEQIMTTLKKAVEIVSTYTGAALPENARRVVRSQLTSLPWRFRQASRASANTAPSTVENGTSTGAGTSNSPQSATASSAHRVLVLAREGLDMIAQVSYVLNGTIVSAEEWCDRLGRRRGPDGGEDEAGRQQPEQIPVEVSGDIKQQQQQPLQALVQASMDVKTPPAAAAELVKEESAPVEREDEKMSGC